MERKSGFRTQIFLFYLKSYSKNLKFYNLNIEKVIGYLFISDA